MIAKYNQKRPKIPEKIKTLIRVNADNKCSICSITFPLEFHHIDEDRENNSEDNIILLCRNCHGKFHGKEISLIEIKQAKINTKNNMLDRNKNFYLNLVCEITDFLYLDNWEFINDMIGLNHCIYEDILNNFYQIAQKISRTSFPNDGYYEKIKNTSLQISQNIFNLSELFCLNKYPNQINYLNNKYYLDRSWKGFKHYSSDEFNKRNLLDIAWETELLNKYVDLYTSICRYQDAVWEILDFEYMDRIYIQGSIHKYLS